MNPTLLKNRKDPVWDTKVGVMAENWARSKEDRAVIDALALLAFDASVLYLAWRFGTRAMAEEFYRLADVFAVVPEDDSQKARGA
jgi:hypothetical protein